MCVCMHALVPDWSYPRLDRFRQLVSLVVALTPVALGLLQQFDTSLEPITVRTPCTTYHTLLLSVLIDAVYLLQCGWVLGWLDRTSPGTRRW